MVSGLAIPSEQLESREPKVGKAKKAQFAAKRAANAPIKAAAISAYKNTKSLPHGKTVYHVPKGAGKPGQTYRGRDVRKAVAKMHMNEAKAAHTPGLSGAQKKKLKTQNFNNRNHVHPKPNGRGGAKPLPGMKVNVAGHHTPAGKEIQLPNKNPGTLLHGQKPPPGPARAILQVNKKGHHVFKGVIAHDQSRTAGSPGVNDHFKVRGVKPRH